MITFSLSLSKELCAQNDVDGWIFELGTNIVDVRDTSQDIGVLISDYYGPDEWLENMLIRLSAERTLNNKSSIQLGVSSTNLKTLYMKLDSENDPVPYLSVDLSYKHYFSDLNFFRRLRPYVIAGGTYQSLDENQLTRRSGLSYKSSQSQVLLHVGWGVQYWISELVGINLQSIYKHDFDGTADVFQHSLGVIIRAINGGYRSTRRIFD